MEFINKLRLIGDLLEKKPLDSKRLLADVDQDAVFRALENTKEGIRKPVRFTNATMEEDNLAKMPEQDKEILWAAYARIRKSPRQEISVLLDLRERYPDVPCIYNYLGVAYNLVRDDELALDTFLETVRKFPKYLFGKITLAEYYINHGQHRKIPKIFDRKFEIYEHYPKNVDLFHISEVRSFYCVVGRYWTRTNKVAHALGCYFLLEDVDPDHPTTRQLGDEIILRETRTLQENFKKYAPRSGKRRKRTEK